MENKSLIPLEMLCAQYNCDTCFFEEGQEYGLIDFKIIQGEIYIEVEDIKVIETIIRLHFDLKINMEGIGVILNLLEKMNSTEKELHLLKSKVRNLEDYFFSF